MDSIRPLRNYNGGIVPKAVLNGTLGTVVYASNYNDLDNKPSINSVELRGNKTAEDLGLATPADITVKSVNNQTGDVSLTGQNIPYDSKYSVTEKINDLESQITDSGVTSVNGKTGVVELTGTDINYSVGVTLNAKIDAVENEIPEVNYPVTSVNGETGAVDLTGNDIEYSEGVSINTQLDNVAGDLADLTAEDIPMSGTDSTPTATAIGDLSQLTTTDKSSLVGAVNEVNANASNLCKHIVLQHLTNDYTFTATSQTRIFAEEENITLTKGKYLFEVTLPAIWTNSSGVIHGGIRLNTTYTESSMIYGPEQMSGLLSFRGVMTVGANTTYKLSSAFRTDSSKPLTVKAYVSPTITLWKVNESN